MWHHLSYPRVVALVTTRCKEKDNILAVAWHSPLSFDPPLFGVLIAKQRFSHQLLQKAKDFGVNFLEEKHKQKVLCCGRLSGEKVDKFEACKLTRRKAKRIDSPLVEEACAWLECELLKKIEVGDHTLFIGRVVDWGEKTEHRILQDRLGLFSIRRES